MLTSVLSFVLVGTEYKMNKTEQCEFDFKTVYIQNDNF